MSALAAGVMSWGKEDVRAWLTRIGLERYSETLCDVHNMDGPALLMLQESDLRQPPLQMTVLGDIKRLVFHLAELRLDSPPLGSRALYCLAPKPSSSYSLASDSSPSRSQKTKEVGQESLSTTTSDEEGDLQHGSILPPRDARGERLALLCKTCQTALRYLLTNHSIIMREKYACQVSKEQLFNSLSCRALENCPGSHVSKNCLSLQSCRNPPPVPHLQKCVSCIPLKKAHLRYGMAVSWLTALVMTVVHDRVPDMAKYVVV